jgi:hypothetical protein
LDTLANCVHVAKGSRLVLGSSARRAKTPRAVGGRHRCLASERSQRSGLTLRSVSKSEGFIETLDGDTFTLPPKDG